MQNEHFGILSTSISRTQYMSHLVSPAECVRFVATLPSLRLALPRCLLSPPIKFIWMPPLNQKSTSSIPQSAASLQLPMCYTLRPNADSKKLNFTSTTLHHLIAANILHAATLTTAMRIHPAQPSLPLVLTMLHTVLNIIIETEST